MAIVVDNKIKQSVIQFLRISERVIPIKISGQPLNINVIQVHAPTADKPENKIRDFYKNVNQGLKIAKENVSKVSKDTL